MDNADARWGDFLRELAHEFGNAVLPVRLLQQMLRPEVEPPSPELLEEFLNDLVPSVTRLTNDLRRISRIARWKYDFAPQSLELAAIVEQAAGRVRPELESRRHELKITLPAAPLRLWADPELLPQALENLLDNAVRYTPPGGRLTIHAVSENGDAVLCIADNGPGIAPEILPHVFEMFVRGKEHADFRSGNLGIGLSFVRRVVEQHAGTIQVSSNATRPGAEFTIRLPLAN